MQPLCERFITSEDSVGRTIKEVVENDDVLYFIFTSGHVMLVGRCGDDGYYVDPPETHLSLYCRHSVLKDTAAYTKEEWKSIEREFHEATEKKERSELLRLQEKYKLKEEAFARMQQINSF